MSSISTTTTEGTDRQLRIKDAALRAIGYSRGVRLPITVACVAGALRVGASLTFVWVSKLIIDAATSPDVPAHELIWMSATMVALLLVEMLMMLITRWVTTRSEIDMRRNMQTSLFDHIMRLPGIGPAESHSGDLINRVIDDSKTVSGAICRSLPEIFVMGLQLVGALWLMYSMSPTLAICILFILPACVLLSKLYVRRMRLLTADVRKDDSRLQSMLQESIRHRMVVQALESGRQISQRFASIEDSLTGHIVRRLRFSIFSGMMMRLGFIGGYLTAFIWSIWNLQSGLITFGMMTAFLQLVARIQFPLSALSRYLPEAVQAITSVDRLAAIESIPAEPVGEQILMKAPAGIRFSDVTFAYPRGGEVISHFSFDFAPGTVTALTGTTGAGKTTMLKLIMAMLAPTEGSITIYDSTHSEKVSASTRCNIVYVPQGNTIFHGTVRENLLLADPDATDAQMQHALHLAVADFVMDLPEGLDTLCGEQGATLSEGQAQRIAIARSLLRPGSILLLDEINSALDAETSRQLIERLQSVVATHTVIIVSHREDIISQCRYHISLNQ